MSCGPAGGGDGWDGSVEEVDEVDKAPSPTSSEEEVIGEEFPTLRLSLTQPVPLTRPSLR